MNKATFTFKGMRSVMLLAVVTILSCTGNDDVKNDDVSGDYYIPGAANVINLSKLVADELTDATFTVTNGMVLTDTLDGQTQKIKIVIADGATVTLADAAINGVHYGGSRDTECLWAGLTCLGDATIILADGTTNTVTNFNRNYPCIHVTEGKTLVIKGGTDGTGKLIANNTSLGVGIGGGDMINCGNIRIEGGIIQANGGSGAGIGSGVMASCGDITITGGNIKATGDSGAGIGTGFMSSCGYISISGGEITATGGDNGAGIGTGREASCGDISISGGVILAMGGKEAAGIGCGNGDSSCGDIILSYRKNFVKVTAIRGKDAEFSIGVASSLNERNSCGLVKIGSNIVKEAYNNSIEVQNDMYIEDIDDIDDIDDIFVILHFTISTTVPEGETDEGPYRDNTWTLEPVDF